jgi:hypothetical protein
LTFAAIPKKLLQCLSRRTLDIFSFYIPPHLPGYGVKPWHFLKKQF